MKVSQLSISNIQINTVHVVSPAQVKTDVLIGNDYKETLLEFVLSNSEQIPCFQWEQSQAAKADLLGLFMILTIIENTCKKFCQEF